MPALKIARVYLAAISLAILALAAVRLTSVVPNGEGGQCGPGWTREYEGLCDAALKGRQYEVLAEVLLAASTFAMGLRALRDDSER
jgi:hypothetical protein